MDFSVVPDFGGNFDGWSVLPVNEGPVLVIDGGHDHHGHAHVEIPVPAIPEVNDHLHCGGEFTHNDHGTHITIGCQNDLTVHH